MSGARFNAFYCKARHRCKSRFQIDRRYSPAPAPAQQRPLDTFIPFTYDALSLTQPVLISQLPAMRKRRGRFGGANG